MNKKQLQYELLSALNDLTIDDIDNMLNLKKDYEELKERTRMQLAACEVAALSNTKESINLYRIDKSNPSWTRAYEAICDAIDREIALREKLEIAIKELESIRSYI